MEWQYEDLNVAEVSLGEVNLFGSKANQNYQAIAQPLIAPPHSMLSKLMQLARMGDIIAIQDEVTLLQETDPTFNPFATQVLEYARDFQVKRIREFLESQQEKILL